eukprot:Hpha_TRINITY_DN430_c0_g1::TRINITY_DN430_c0_g1_i2::g.27576::m.27576
MAGWFGGAADTLKALQGRAAELSAQAKEAGVRAAEKVKEKAEERGLGEYLTLDERYTKQGKAQEASELAPWEQVPEAWAEGRAADWEVLVRALHSDEATFTVGPRGDGLGEEEVASLEAAGVGAVDWSWAEGEVELRTRASEAALGDAGLSGVRHTLVPRAVKEGVFWSRYWWKLRELGKLRQTSQVRPLLRVLNAGGRPDGVAERVEEAERGRRRAAETLRQCEEEMRTSSDNVALLRRMQQRTLAGGGKSDSPELMESVYESCKYHKQKVASLMARLEDLAPEQRVGKLAPGSDLFVRLEEVNKQLGAVLADHRRGGFAGDTAGDDVDEKVGEKVEEEKLGEEKAEE